MYALLSGVDKVKIQSVKAQSAGIKMFHIALTIGYIKRNVLVSRDELEQLISASMRCTLEEYQQVQAPQDTSEYYTIRQLAEKWGIGRKAKLDTKDASDKDEAVKRLAVKLEPVIRFFGGSTPENINKIFKSKDASVGCNGMNTGKKTDGLEQLRTNTKWLRLCSMNYTRNCRCIRKTGGNSRRRFEPYSKNR